MAFHRKPGFILFALFSATVLSFIDRQLLNILVRPIRADVGVSDVEFSLLQGAAFGLVYSIAALPMAYLSDRFSPRKVTLAAIAAWSAMTLLFGLADSFMMLMIARVGLAIGEAGLSPAAISIIRRTYPMQRQSFAVAILSASIYIGGGFSMLIGGPALSALEALAGDLPFGLAPWRALFAACAVLGAVGFSFLFLMPETQQAPTTRTNSSLSSFFRLVVVQRATVGSYLAAFIGIHALVVAVMSWTPAMFVRTHGWSEHEVGLAYGLVFIVGGLLGALGSGRLVGLLMRAGSHSATVVVARGAALLLGVASVLSALIPHGPTALVFAALTMVGVGALLAIGAFGLQAFFPKEFSARATAIYFLIPGAFGASLGPTAVAMLGATLGSDGDIAMGLTMFSMLTTIWAMVWLTLLLHHLRTPASPALAAGAVNES